MSLASEAPQVLFSVLCAHGIFRYAAFHRHLGVRSSLEFRLGFLLLAAGALCVMRAVRPFFADEITAPLRVERAFAALTVFGAFLFVEAIKRRHFTLPVKILACGLASAMTVIALLNLSERIPATGIAYHVCGLALLLVTAAALLFRDRADITAIENHLADGCLIAGGLAVLLTALEYANWYSDLGLRLAPSPIAVMALLFFVIRIGDGTESIRRLLAEQGRLVFKAFLIGGLFTLTFTGGLRPADLVMGFFTAWTLRLVVSISEYAHHRQREYSDASFLGWLAHASPGPGGQLTASLASVPGFGDLTLIQERDLEGFDAQVLRDFYRQNHATVLSTSLIRQRTRRGGDGARTDLDAVEMIGALLARHQRTHGVCLALQPLTLGLVTLPELASGVVPDLKMGVLQNFALSFEQRSGPAAAEESP